MSDLTLRQLYDFCRNHALDCEIRVKSDGRGYITFERYQDRWRGALDFDFEREVEHLPEVLLAKLNLPPVKSADELRRLETPR